MRKQWLKTFIPAMALAALPVVPAVSQAGVAIGVSITLAPPVLPVYVQPALPAPGYIWQPGYWAWGDDGYYWVPGTWVLPPEPGLLWTPGYWGWVGGAYIWHVGYWGPHVGFYGGINYGCGYTGVGFQGGYWRGGAFFYNRAVMNTGSVHVTNVYNRTVINNVTVNRVSFNGGHGGIEARPTAHELTAEHERHFQPTSAQMNHEHAAFSDRDLRASVNHGRPAVAATARPGEFSGHGVVAARGSGPQGGATHEMTHNTHEMTRNDRPPGAHGGEGHGGPTPGGHVAEANRPAGTAGHATPMMRNDRPPGAGSGNPAVARRDFHSGGGGGGTNHFAPNTNGGHGTPSQGSFSGNSHPANMNNSRPAPNGGFPGGGHSAPNMGSRPAPGGGGGHAPSNMGGGYPGGGGHAPPNMGGGYPGGGGHAPSNMGRGYPGGGGHAPPNMGGGRPAPSGGGGHPQQQGHRPEGRR